MLVDGVIPMNRGRTTHSLFVGFLIAASVVAAAARATPIPSYKVYSLGADTTGSGISPDGTYVSGYDLVNGSGFVWTVAGGVRWLPNVTTDPARIYAQVNAVNDSGVAAGSQSQASWGSSPVPVLWSGGSAALIELPAASSFGRAYGINASGVVAGAIESNGSWYATMFSGTGPTVLLQTTPSGDILRNAYGVADTGRIVGQANSTAGPETKGFYLDSNAASAVDIGSLPGGGFATFASGINASGSAITGSSGSSAFIYDTATATMTAIPWLPGWTNSAGDAVNDDGWVVGNGGSDTSILYLFDGTTTSSLQSLLSEADAASWDMVSGTTNGAFGISNNGVITGRGLLDGVITGFVMVPVAVPEVDPATCSIPFSLVAGVIGILEQRRRRVRPVS
jgi:hypothetical protein